MTYALQRASISARVLFVLSIASCSPTRAEPNTLPCDIQQTLRANCLSCHAQSPLFGAPMPLITYADLHAPSRTDPSQPVFQRVGARIHDAMRPMPPTGALSTSERDRLDQWIASGAPGSDQPSCPTSDAEDNADATDSIGPQFLPCTESEQTRFTAHGIDSSQSYQVPVDASDLYVCFTVASPFQAATEATAFAAIIGDARVVHHFSIYQTSVPQTDRGPSPCRIPSDATVLWIWAPGRENQIEPVDIGIELAGPNQWLILEMHYHNLAGYTDALDTSGIAMCTTTTSRAHAARVSLLGSTDIAVPPHAVAFPVTNVCRPTLTAPVHIVNAAPHMHRLGSSFRTEILRGGDPARAELLVDIPRWNFEQQSTYPVDALINPTDTLRTTCSYTNTTEQTVYFGPRSVDEMCGNSVVVWPSPGLVNVADPGGHNCFGPP